MALFAAAGLVMSGMGVPSANAADRGGDCCANLEERVAELEATAARNGNRRVSLTVSGQVSTMLMHWNDGNSARGSDLYLVNNEIAGGTFFSFTGSARINSNVTAGFQVVVALETGTRSHQVNQLDDDLTPSTDIQITVTLANWYLDHEALGRVRVGRINTATAGVTTIDFGDAGVIANASIGYTQSGMFLALNDVLLAGRWTTALGGDTVNIASLSRANAISYTSPTIGGFWFGAAFGEDNIWDVALRYAGEMGGFRIGAGIGYISNSTGLDDSTTDHSSPLGNVPRVWKGSASVMHVGSGLYLTGAVVNSDLDVVGALDARLYYLQGGISKNWSGLGNTVIYGEWARVNDGIINDLFGNFGGNANDIIVSSEATMWGIGLVQHFDAAAMELFLAYKRFSAEIHSPVADGGVLNGTVSYNDMDVALGGARIRF